MELRRNAFVKYLSLVALAGLVSGCSHPSASFSLLEEQDSFSQIPQVINGKIDVLWMIDNSGSMASSQTNVANNFASFIDKFNAKGFDYRMAVATSDAWRTLFSGKTAFAKYKDGTDATSHSGVFIIDPTTPNLNEVFLTNVIQGTEGSGDERAFQSLTTALSHPVNAAFEFPRKDAFLAVIIVSDEDDFSHDDKNTAENNYDFVGLHSVQSYIDALDEFTGYAGSTRNYNVNSITIKDQTCLDQLNAEKPGRLIGQRYMQISNATNGVVASLCGNFGETMSEISNRIIQLSTRFPLSREPNPNTIRVWVDGTEVPRSDTDGWQYEVSSNSIVFVGSTFVPNAGSAISVTFDPTTIK